MITLRGMRFHARVGVLPHEQEFAQPLEIDLMVWVTPAPVSASPESVLDYRELYDLVRATVHGLELHYLEEVAAAIAGQALQHTRVERVRAAVRKPHVALPGPLQHAEVVVEMDRT